jgi:hypothetical protein
MFEPSDEGSSINVFGFGGWLLGQQGAIILVLEYVQNEENDSTVISLTYAVCWESQRKLKFIFLIHLQLTSQELGTEPVFVNLFSSARIDSQPGGSVRQPYLSYRPARLHRLAESMPRNRFLGSINVYKYGLRKGDK